MRFLHTSSLRVGIIFVGFLSLCCCAFAQGGPPLITDDPGTVENGKWEINVAWVNSTFSHNQTNELPHFDANRGISDRAHFKIEVPWMYANVDGHLRNGDGGGSTGVKYRFIDGKGSRPSISTYPAFDFALSSRSARLGLSESPTVFTLPFQIEWDFPKFSLNTDFGYVVQPGSGPQWMGGLAIGSNYRGTDLLAEIHGEGSWSAHESSWVAQLGLRRELNAKQTLLFAFGKSISGPSADRLDWTSYLGIQFHT